MPLCQNNLDNSTVVLDPPKMLRNSQRETKKVSVIYEYVKENEENSHLAALQEMKDFSSCLLHVVGRLRSGPGNKQHNLPVALFSLNIHLFLLTP